MGKGKVIKRILTIMIVFIVVMAGVFYIGIQSRLKAFSKEVSQIQVNDINIENVDDGMYVGEYYVNESVGAVVRVTVENNKITNIDFIEHEHARGEKAEKIVNTVIHKQSLNVDTISGATGSSIIILKAIEDALVK